MSAWLLLLSRQASYYESQRCKAVDVARESTLVLLFFSRTSVVINICSKLAWANTGSIAHISADGSKVSFYVLVRDMKTKLWTISTASKFPVTAPQGRTFVHVQFSGIGIDLAIVDSSGMVHMRSLAGALGRMVPAERDPTRDIHPKNELDTVVGMHWLGLWPAEFTVSCAFLMPASLTHSLTFEGPLHSPGEQEWRSLGSSLAAARATFNQGSPPCCRKACHASH